MSSFTEKLVLTQIGPELWQTTREFSYHVGYEGSPDVITVPEGFITDCASVPFPAKMFIPVSGQYNQAAVVHDYLYATQTRTRKEADDIFLEAMTVLGVNWFKRQVMYRAVRLGGWLPWNHHKKQLESKND